MNFNNLYKKISNIDSGVVNECSCDNTGPAEHTQPDSVNMNISFNGQGSGGIRDLMDILRNIETTGQGDAKIIVGEPRTDSEPMIIDTSTMHELEPSSIDMDPSDEIIDDSFANSTADKIDPMKYAIDAVIATGDDLSSKGKGALKANGGENPWNVDASLIKHLSELYETIKTKTLNETRNLPGYGDEATWGGRTPYGDDDDVEAYGITRTVDEVEIDLPSNLEQVVPSGFLSVTYEFNEHGNLELHKVESYDEEKNEMVDVTKFKEYLKNPIWAWIEKNDLDNYDDDYKRYWQIEKNDLDNYDDDYKRYWKYDGPYSY